MIRVRVAVENKSYIELNGWLANVIEVPYFDALVECHGEQDVFSQWVELDHLYLVGVGREVQFWVVSGTQQALIGNLPNAKVTIVAGGDQA